jgi:hypothetical protein
MVGYINVVDANFIYSDSEDKAESDDENYYRGMVRVHLDCLFQFADSCQYIEDRDVVWDDWGMESPLYIIFTDGPSARSQPTDMFLFSPDQEVKRTTSITEREYNERQ